MSRVSFIITTYNVEAYVATALQSVIDCDFPDCEVILVDDGSRDATRQVAELVMRGAPSYMEFKPVYFASNSIGGVACAANVGLARATGKFVVFIDGDDWILPQALRGAVTQLMESNADFVVCGCKEYWNNTGTYTQYPEDAHWEQARQSGNVQRRREILLKMAPFPWRKVYRRDFLERNNIRFPVGDYFFEDNPFHWETTVKAGKFLFYPSVTHVHRMMRQGQTVTGMGIKPLQIFDHAKTIVAMLREQGAWEEQRLSYFDWLVKHVLWCTRYVSPSGLNLLFDRATAALEPIGEVSFSELLANGSFSLSEVRQLTALQVKDRLGFLAEIEDQSTAQK